MVFWHKKIFWLVIILLLVGLAIFLINKTGPTEKAATSDQAEGPGTTFNGEVGRMEFARLSALYRFSAELPSDWRAEFVPATEAINVFDPNSGSGSNLEKSQIFIRYFEAGDFLTLNTVDILSRESTQVRGHDAVQYEIRKKSGVANFANQPAWRSGQHKLIDIRLAQTNPSVFYVIAYNPELTSEVFEKFIASLIFHNDAYGFVDPLPQASSRVTKKPFGLRVSPQNSPVSPERFSGYHNAVDYEILPGEETLAVPVAAVCGGPLLQKRTASGYGGLLIQSCLFGNQAVTVLYGHMDINSVNAAVGSYMLPGQTIGELGEVGQETDGERKHLHLGLHKGTNIDIRGYVQNESELGQWLDFENLK